MESQLQNPEFKINPEIFHPCIHLVEYIKNKKNPEILAELELHSLNCKNMENHIPSLSKQSFWDEQSLMTYPVVSTVIPRPFPGCFSPLGFPWRGLALTAGRRIPRTTPLTG